MSFPAYSDYKETGSNWLGSIPVHWRSFDGKRIFNNRRAPSNADDEQLAVTQNMGVVPQKFFMERSGNKVVLALKGTDGFRYVSANDFVISLRSFQGGIEHSEYSGCVSPAYTVLAPAKEIVPGYYKYLLKSSPYIQALQAATDSLREGKSITYEQFGPIALPYPGYEEQRAIATFLDNETTRIDRLIEKQRQLIALLKEKRQAAISHAVTKGLDPNVPMKESGIEWLGEVPEHWIVVRVKHVSTFITSGPRGWSDYLRDGADAIFLQSGDLNDHLEILPEKANRVEPPPGAEGVRTKAMQGDVVICITGANTGRVAVIDELPATTYINQHLSLVRFSSRKISPLFAGYSLSSGPGQVHFTVTQYGLKEGLSLGNVSEAPLALAPLGEQEKIVRELTDKLAKLDGVAKRATEMIVLLQERRTALISAAVTGKIDVRNHPSAQAIEKEVA